MEHLYELFKQWAFESAATMASITTAIDKLRNALQTLELIISLDREKNTPEQYREGIITILQLRGWID